MRKIIVLILVLMILMIFITPPLIPAPFTTENSNWDGVSEFKKILEANSFEIMETTQPLRLLGNLDVDIIIIIGANLPYFREDGNFLREFVSEGGNVILFEDRGYAKSLASSFGINFGGTVVDRDYFDLNPYHPIINQSSLFPSNSDIEYYTLVFNKAVRVQQSFALANTQYFPLLATQGTTWEDSNNDGKFYRTRELISPSEGCFLGGFLEFQTSNGKFVTIGDSALPTNDMIEHKENKKWLLDLIKFLEVTDGNKILFDESRKIWLPPTGKAAVGLLSVLILGIFHSPLISILTIIVIGTIIFIKKESNISKSIENYIKSRKSVKLEHIPAFLQSEEEEDLAHIAKRQEPNLYRVLLTDHVQEIIHDLNEFEKRDIERTLRKRLFDVQDYNKVIKRIKTYSDLQIKKGENQYESE
jgi:uncharacterized protein YxeA